MKASEVIQLAIHGFYENTLLNASLIETHISWVLLCKDFAFKIKKPVALPFLNFSTLRLRKHFCKREIKLNKEYSDIYLKILPIRRDGDSFWIGKGSGIIIDYCVKMKRIETNKKMDIMLASGKVSEIQIIALAKLISSIHLKAEKIVSEFNISSLSEAFNGILEIRPFVLEYMGESNAVIIDKSIQWSHDFLKKHSKRLEERNEAGFTRLVHGDLHCGNIFLDNPPHIFDCIEFDDNLRKIDLLSEIGFLAMDMEAHGGSLLSQSLIETYNELTGVIQNNEDFEILNFYKCYRANVRAKVLIISAKQHLDKDNFREKLLDAEKYFKLISNYLSIYKS